MRWEIERYVKLYRRDTPEWISLSWRARGLFAELLRKCDLDGTIECGRFEPAQAVGLLIRGPADELRAPLAELLEDGCIRDMPAAGSRGRRLLIRNYRAAQEIPLTGAERTARWREGVRAELQGKSPQADECDDVTPRADPIRADPSEPAERRSRARARGDANGCIPPAGTTAAEGTLIERLRADLSDQLDRELVVARSRNRAATIRSVVAAVNRCGYEQVLDACLDAAEDADEPPESVAFFARNLDELQPARKRKPGELPKKGDPDFNDPVAWGTELDAFMHRGSKEPPPGYVVPKYKRPLTLEEEQEQERRRAGANGAAKP